LRHMRRLQPVDVRIALLVLHKHRRTSSANRPCNERAF
jgi:hypothetical protein